jgi:hypothetical protein
MPPCTARLARSLWQKARWTVSMHLKMSRWWAGGIGETNRLAGAVVAAVGGVVNGLLAALLSVWRRRWILGVHDGLLDYALLFWVLCRLENSPYIMDKAEFWVVGGAACRGRVRG